MVPKQQEFPSNPMNQDLYSQIASGDVGHVEAKPKQSFVMSLMVDVMRLTLLLDEKRRQYQGVFRFLGWAWKTMMVLLYATGIVMVCILVYSYIQFPNLIKDYFDRNGVSFEKMEIPGYVMSSVKVTGLHDKNNSYRIDNLTINSNFGDFLQGRIKSVVLNGVRVNLEKEDKTSVSNTLIPLLMYLNDSRKSSLGVRVDSLEIQDATLTIKGRNFELPVQFSLTGIYGDETNMSAYLMVDKPNLAFQGPLVIRGKGAETTFDLDIHAGQVKIPGRPPENMIGKMSISTKNNGIQSVQGQLTLSENRQEKVAKLNLTRDKDNTFKGDLDFSWLDIMEKNKRDEQLNIALSMTGLSFDKQGLIKTEKPLRLSLRSKKTNFQIGRLNAQLEGKLECLMVDNCSYRLDKNARVSINQLSFPFQTDLIKGGRESNITLQASPKLFSFPFSKGEISFDANIVSSSFNGQRESDKGSVSFRSGKGRLQGNWNLKSDLVNSGLKLERINFQTPDYRFSDTELIMAHIFGVKPRIKIKSPRVLITDNKWFKKPFSLNYESKDENDEIEISFPKERLRIFINGDVNPLTGYVDARFSIPPTELANMGKPLSDFSVVFPEGIQSASGKIAVEGRLVGVLKNGLSGPLSVAFNDVALTTSNMSVEGLNTVLQVQTLKPFVTASKQPIFIRRMLTAIPFNDVLATFKIDNQFLRIDTLSANVAGIPLQGDPMVVPYQDINTLLYLRQKNSDISSVANSLKIPNWQLKPPFRGRAYLVLSFKNKVLQVNRGSLLLNEGKLSYTGKSADKPKELGKENDVRIQSGTLEIEQKAEDKNGVSVSLNLNTIVSGSKKPWPIQMSETESILPLFVAPTEKSVVPAEISSAIQSVFRRSETATKR